MVSGPSGSQSMSSGTLAGRAARIRSASPFCSTAIRRALRCVSIENTASGRLTKNCASSGDSSDGTR
ncbi:hypothetical protein D3C72_2408350 [compost metagenome]